MCTHFPQASRHDFAPPVGKGETQSPAVLGRDLALYQSAFFQFSGQRDHVCAPDSQGLSYPPLIDSRVGVHDEQYRQENLPHASVSECFVEV